MIQISIDTREAEQKLVKIGRSLNKRGLLKAKRFGTTWVTTPAAVETYRASSRLHKADR